MQILFTVGGVVIGIIVALRRTLLAWIQNNKFDTHSVNRTFGKICKIPLPTNFKECYIKINSLSIYDDTRLKVDLIYRFCELYVIAIIALMIILYINNNYVHMITLIPIVFLFCESLMQNYVNETYIKFLSALDSYCQRITTSYNRTFNVSKTMEEVVTHDILKKFSIMMSSMCYENDTTREYLYTLRSVGHPIVLQLAEIIRTCSNLGVPGTTIDKSPFMVNMLRFTEYVQNELHICEARSSKFSVNKYIMIAIAGYYAFLPLMINNWFSSIEHVFNGAQGLVQRLIFVIIWSGMFVFSEENAKSLITREMDITTLNEALVENFKPILDLFVPKNQDKIKKIKIKLIDTASFLTIDNYYMSKISNAFIITVLAFVLIITGLKMTKETIYNSTASFGEAGNWGLTEDNIDDFIDTDKYFLNMTDENFNKLSKEEIISIYESNIPDISDIQAERCVSRIKHKITAYKETRIPGYFPFLILAALILGYNLPDILLKLRRIAKEEVRRIDIDSIMNMLVLYSFTYMIVDNIIAELSNMTKILNKELVYIREISGERKRNFVDRQSSVKEDLALIYDKFYAMETSLTVKEAMSNIPGIVDSRRQTTNYNMNKKMESVAGMLAVLFLLPMLYMTMFMLVTPMMNVSLSSFTEAMSTMGN